MVDGTCCLKIFSKSNYHGVFEVLLPGSYGGYNIPRIRSFRFLECENQYFTSTTPATTTSSTTLSTTTAKSSTSCTKEVEFFNTLKTRRFVNIENLKNKKRNNHNLSLQNHE